MQFCLLNDCEVTSNHNCYIFKPRWIQALLSSNPLGGCGNQERANQVLSLIWNISKVLIRETEVTLEYVCCCLLHRVIQERRHTTVTINTQSLPFCEWKVQKCVVIANFITFILNTLSVQKLYCLYHETVTEKHPFYTHTCFIWSHCSDNNGDCCIQGMIPNRWVDKCLYFWGKKPKVQTFLMKYRYFLEGGLDQHIYMYVHSMDPEFRQDEYRMWN